MEALVKGLSPSGEKIVPSYLSGASSGFISAVALNAILEQENGFTWDDYKEMLFNITSSDVFDNSWEGIAKILTYNIYEGYFLDNSRLAAYLAPYLQKMNYEKFGDLYLPTAVTLVNQSSGDSIRFWSNDPRYADLNLIELLLATAALPIAFPTRTVTGLGSTIWIDGGTGIDTLPVYAPLHNPNVTQLFILCYGSAFTSGGSELPDYLNDIAILANTMAAINDMRVDLFNGGIDIVQRANISAYGYIPQLNQTFSALDFDHEKYEYEVTSAWTRLNNPMALNNKAFYHPL